jgi:hypothetical protein
MVTVWVFMLSLNLSMKLYWAVIGIPERVRAYVWRSSLLASTKTMVKNNQASLYPMIAQHFRRLIILVLTTDVGKVKGQWVRVSMWSYCRNFKKLLRKRPKEKQKSQSELCVPWATFRISNYGIQRTTFTPRMISAWVIDILIWVHTRKYPAGQLDCDYHLDVCDITTFTSIYGFKLRLNLNVGKMKKIGPFHVLLFSSQKI